MNSIPLCDLKEQYSKIRDEILAAIDEVCSNSAFIKGEYVRKFESEFVRSNRANFGIGCSNGTSAISLALEALGIGKGDEVLLPSHTFVATAEAICHVGATPVFCDIKPCDYTIDVDDAYRKITHLTKAIIPVHIYGTPCDMDEIMKLAGQYNLKVIEDCAQAHFAQYKGKYVGTFGDCGSFSFYPGKNLGAYGDAGFVLCKDQIIHEKLLRLIDHGRLDKFDHEIVGYNHRIDAIQASILSVKMKYIMEWTQARVNIAKLYDKILSEARIKFIKTDKIKSPVYHVYNIEVENRDLIQSTCKKMGISTGIHYPIPVHKMLPYQAYKAENLQVTERISSKIMSLPIFPEMTEESVKFVTQVFA